MSQVPGKGWMSVHSLVPAVQGHVGVHVFTGALASRQKFWKDAYGAIHGSALWDGGQERWRETEFVRLSSGCFYREQGLHLK